MGASTVAIGNIGATMQRDGTHMLAVPMDLQLGCCLGLGKSESCLSLAPLDCKLWGHTRSVAVYAAQGGAEAYSRPVPAEPHC